MRDLDSEGFFDDAEFWARTPTRVQMFEGIKNIIPASKSWSKDLVIFGNEESNCIEVYTESGYVKSVSFRVDFTRSYEFFLDHIVEFCITHGLAIIDQDLEILRLDSQYISGRIESSPEAKKYRELVDRQSPE